MKTPLLFAPHIFFSPCCNTEKKPFYAAFFSFGMLFLSLVFSTADLHAAVILSSTPPSTADDYRTVGGNDQSWSNPVIWQKFNGTSWNAAGADGVPPATATVYIFGAVDTGGARTADKIIVEGGAVLTVSEATVSTTQTLIKSGGSLRLNAAFTNNGVLEIEDKGTLLINFAAASGISPLWNGTEKFSAGSTVIIQTWNYSAGSGANRLLQNPAQISPNAQGYYFGNLVISGSPSSAFILVKGDQEVNLCENDFTMNSTGKNVIFTDGASTVRVGGNLNVEGSQLSLSGTAAGTSTIFVGGNLSIVSGILDINQSKVDAVTTLSLQGNLFVASGGLLTSTDNNSRFIFSGKGDGITSLQTVDVFDNGNAGNSCIDFTVNSGAYLKLVNRNFGLGTNSSLVLNSGATLDFNFKDETALNVVRSSTSLGGVTTGQIFDAQAGSTLKISAPEGIISGGAYAGNVGVGVTSSTRIYSPGANYIYVGKANPQQALNSGADQVSGSGFPTGSLAGNIIIDLDTKNAGGDDVSFMAQGIHKLTSIGSLKIIKGKVIDKSGNGFDQESKQSADLTMVGGRYQISRSETQPPLSGKYTLTGGVIEFAGDAAVVIRDKSYLNVEVSGTNVSIGAVTKGLELQAKGKFTVKKNATLKIGNDEGFSGGAKTAINATNNPTIVLEDFSTIEYNKDANQTITSFNPLTADESNLSTGGYYNLKVSGNDGDLVTGTSKKTLPTNPVYVRNNIIVSPAARLIIGAGETLTVRNEVINNGRLPTNFIVENEGNLLQLNGITNATPISVRRMHKLSTQRKEYNFVSSPVKNQHLKYIFGNSPFNLPYVTAYNEKTDYFSNAKEGDYQIAGKGFSISEPVVTYLGTAVESLAFNEAEYKGVPNNGDINLRLERTDANHGYNLGGNPYPSNLDIVALYKNSSVDHDIDPTFYFWDNSMNDIYTQMGQDYDGYSYAVFNAAAGSEGYGVAAPGRREKEGNNVGTKVPTRFVKSTQGFMVRALKPGAMLKFNNTQRKTATAGVEFFGKRKVDDRYRLEMISSEGVLLQNGIVYFLSGNYGLGSEDSDLPNPNASDALFTWMEGDKLVINGRSSFNTEDIIFLGTHHYKSGIYKIRAMDGEGIFGAGQPIFLKDKKTGDITDISTASYEFKTDAGKFTNRFEIVYRTEKSLRVENVTKKNLLFYNEGSNFVAKLTSGKINVLEVYDMNGRLIYQNKMVGGEIRFNKDILPVGVFVINVIGVNGEIYHEKFRND